MSAVSFRTARRSTCDAARKEFFVAGLGLPVTKREQSTKSSHVRVAISRRRSSSRIWNKSEQNDMATLPLIVFDVNETLLDLHTMEPTFERIFGEKSAMRLWFANLIMYSGALTVAVCYVPFTDIG
jgi:hypothetical protein